MEALRKIALVHGDAKPGNYAFVGDDVSAVFDWELAAIGDPLTDVGWAELNWRFPGFFTAAPGAPSADELVERWEERTGFVAQHRRWYRGLEYLKIAAILLVGGHLAGHGHTDDPRLATMATGAPRLVEVAVAELRAAEPD